MYFYVLILATVHLFILTRLGEALPTSFTIANFIPYFPKSFFTWGSCDAPKPQILDTSEKNADQKRNNPHKIKKNPSINDRDWFDLPPSIWVNPEKYWLPTESVQVPETSRTTRTSKPALIAIAKPKTRKHRHKHSRRLPKTKPTEIPIVQKRTKLLKSRNPLCYFTMPCAD
ncbi:hypothetical protein Ddc_22423 [Ditylenchus destructor]|nr:hypothetical protein Ddc_22423 [Ditylenchus destructor]